MIDPHRVTVSAPTATSIIIERRKLAEPRRLTAAEAEQLFQERVIELECSCTTLTADPI